ncbi:MAG: hypothetical protein AAGN66_07820 [Acidobacteriota bacterium]
MSLRLSTFFGLLILLLAVPTMADTAAEPLTEPQVDPQTQDELEVLPDPTADAWQRLFGPTLEDLAGPPMGDAQTVSHCGNSWTCTYNDGGIGCFLNECVYRCSCQVCNGTLTYTQCQLIDQGSCIVCPTYI